MKKGKVILIPLVVFLLVGYAMAAGAAALSLVPSKAEIGQGESFTLAIKVDDATGVAGCAFTLVYPQAALTLATTPVSTGFFKLFNDEQQNADPAQIYPYEKNTATTGEVRLSGAYINTDLSTGGGGKYTGGQTLFTINFTVKNDATAGSYNIELKQTQVCNGPLGWGTDANNNGQYDDGDVKVGAPILIKAFSKEDDAWSTNSITDDFETLISSFDTNPQTSFSVTEASTEETYNITIQSSWNLLAIPAIPSNSSIGTLFVGIKDNIASSWKWENNSWAVYLPSLSQEDASTYISSKGFTEITTITGGEGFWVNSEASQTLSVQGSQPETVSYSLNSGWNLVGLKTNQTQSITDLISGNESDISSVWKWDNSSWAVYMPGGGTEAYASSKGFSVLQSIAPNEGFWVNADKALTLN